MEGIVCMSVEGISGRIVYVMAVNVDNVGIVYVENVCVEYVFRVICVVYWCVWCARGVCSVYYVCV